jgi:hypothetical protein
MWNVPSLLTPCSPIKSSPQVVNWPTVETLVAVVVVALPAAAADSHHYSANIVAILLSVKEAN